MRVNFNFCWGNFEWRSAAVGSDADCELNFLNWNECCEQTTILHTVHKKWGKFRTKGWEEKTTKKRIRKSTLMLASHITYNNQQRENSRDIGEIFTVDKIYWSLLIQFTENSLNLASFNKSHQVNDWWCKLFENQKILTHMLIEIISTFTKISLFFYSVDTWTCTIDSAHDIKDS